MNLILKYYTFNIELKEFCKVMKKLNKYPLNTFAVRHPILRNGKTEVVNLKDLKVYNTF
jgi:hypothetical protein